MSLYAVVSSALSVWVMRQADLSWNLVALSTIVPLVVVLAVFRRAVVHALLGRPSRRKVPTSA